MPIPRRRLFAALSTVVCGFVCAVLVLAPSALAIPSRSGADTVVAQSVAQSIALARATDAPDSASGSAVTTAPSAHASATASSGNGWSATLTGASVPPGATVLGPVPNDRPMTVGVSLRMRDRAGMDAYAKRVTDVHDPLYDQTLTPAEIAARWGPRQSDADAVAAYLQGVGLNGIEILQPSRSLVIAHGTPALVSRAFHVSLEMARDQDRVGVVNVTPALVPAAIAGQVESVLGLNEILFRTMATPIPPSPAPHSMAAATIAAAYNPGRTAPGWNSSIAIFMGGPTDEVIADLRHMEARQGLPQVPVRVIGGSKSAPGDDIIEWKLDTQASSAMAVYLHQLVLYDADSFLQVFLEFFRFQNDNLVKAGSASFGACGPTAYSSGLGDAFDAVFERSVVQGQTVFASSGDTGGFCGARNGVPAGTVGVSYPAASPWVASVGGTTLTTLPDGSYLQEAAWNSGGGGQSSDVPEPDWQLGVVPLLVPSRCGSAALCGRSLPDISMDADPLSGLEIYTDTQAADGTPVGGTSLASPLALGAWARFETSHGNRLGFAVPKFYANRSVLNDVVLGVAVPWPATVGYDFATGLGSLDLTKLDAVIR